jgi:hypothetical protein
VELHGLDAGVSLHQLRQLCSQAGPCLQVLAALEGGEAGSGLALAVFASEAAAAQACDLLNNYPLGSAFLRVQRAQSLPGQLIDLLWSVLEPSSAQAQAQAAADAAQASAAAAQTAAYLREQQQQFLDQQRQVAAQRQAWQEQVWGGNNNGGGGDSGGSSGGQRSNNSGSPPPAEPGNSKISVAMFAAQQQQLAVQQQQLADLQADLRHMQLDQERQATRLSGQQRQLSMQAAMQVGQQRQLTGQQQQLHQAAARQGPQSWANAAAQPPSLAALAGGPANSVAANLAAGHANNSGSNDSDEWQTAVASHGRHGRRHGAAGGRLSGSGGTGGDSSVSSGSPHATPPPSLGRRSDEKVPRPGGQDGASADPTTKLWMGGIDGSASAETVRSVFGRFGAIYDYELQPATHEKGRTDQWGCVPLGCRAAVGAAVVAGLQAPKLPGYHTAGGAAALADVSPVVLG